MRPGNSAHLESENMDYLARQKRLAARLREIGVPSLLVTHLPNIRYLCGFTGSAGVLLVVAGQRGQRCTFFTDGRYTQQAADEVSGVRVVIGKRPALTEASEAAVKSQVKILGFEAEQLQYVTFQQLSHALKGKVKLKPLNSCALSRTRPKSTRFGPRYSLDPACFNLRSRPFAPACRRQPSLENWNCKHGVRALKRCHLTPSSPPAAVPLCRMVALQGRPFLTLDLLSSITVLYSRVTVLT